MGGKRGERKKGLVDLFVTSRPLKLSTKAAGGERIGIGPRAGVATHDRSIHHRP